MITITITTITCSEEVGNLGVQKAFDKHTTHIYRHVMEGFASPLSHHDYTVLIVKLVLHV